MTTTYVPLSLSLSSTNTHLTCSVSSRNATPAGLDSQSALLAGPLPPLQGWTAYRLFQCRLKLKSSKRYVSIGHYFYCSLSLNALISQALRNTQLSITRMQTDTRKASRTPPTSSTGSQQATVSAQLPESDVQKKIGKGLSDTAKKLFVLFSPWPLWVVSGESFITAPPTRTGTNPGGPSPARITQNDTVGDHILSFVPHHLHEAFLSLAGQKIVSDIYYSLNIDC
jgi:hypothetical protein